MYVHSTCIDTYIIHTYMIYVCMNLCATVCVCYIEEKEETQRKKSSKVSKGQQGFSWIHRKIHTEWYRDMLVAALRRPSPNPLLLFPSPLRAPPSSPSSDRLYTCAMWYVHTYMHMHIHDNDHTYTLTTCARICIFTQWSYTQPYVHM